MIPRHDLHVHTYLSACCHDKQRHTPANILALAERMGVHTVGFADHVWANPDIAPSSWYAPQNESQIDRLREDLAGVETQVRVLVGCEAETVAPGRFGITPQFAETLDHVVLSCSHFHMKGFVTRPADDGDRGFAEHMLAFFRSAAASGLATTIAHPFVPVAEHHRFDGVVAAMSDIELLDAFGLARDHGTAVELTTGYLPDKGTFSIETPLRLMTLAKQAGCLFTLATDAHDPDGQRRLPELARLIDAVGLTDEDILPLAREE